MNSFAREFSGIKEGAEIDVVYSEDLIAGIQLIDKESLEDFSFVFVHFDCFYNKRDSEYIHQLLATINTFSLNLKPLVICSNAIHEAFPIGAVSKTLGHSIQAIIDAREMIDELTAANNIVFFDFCSSLYSVGYHNGYNYNLGHLYQMPYTKPLLRKMALDFAQLIDLYTTAEKKLLVLDCDNTLWKGIIGEDGIDSVQCDLNADGIIHYHFQQFLKQRKSEGFLLCICSKNNEADVKEVFVKKTMPLQWDDFIVKKVNWKDKHLNINDILQELSLGMDSCVFIDDSDFEINMVKEFLPSVTTFKFTPDYTQFLALTREVVFRRKVISDEDQNKTRNYQEEQIRKNELLSFSSVDDYVKSLEIKLEIKKNDVNDFERLSQLMEKTNQFNFNKKPYSVSDLHNFTGSGKGTIYSLKVSDKYGDYGTVGLLFIRVSQQIATIENYIMSCRVLGRHIEFDFYNQVIADLTSEGIAVEQILFVKTAKNKPAEEFLNKINYANINRPVSANI